MTSDSFEQRYAELTAWLDGSRPLPSDAALIAADFFLEHQMEDPRAWLFYHRAGCILEGAQFMSETLIRDASSWLGEQVTPEILFQMRCDRLVGVARYANLEGIRGMALTVAEQFMDIRDKLFEAVNNDPELLAYAHYAYGRVTQAASLPEIAHLSFRLADETRQKDSTASGDIRTARTLVFLLRMAIEFGITAEIETVSARLQQAAPDAWEQYGTRLCAGDLGWFDRLDIRW